MKRFFNIINKIKKKKTQLFRKAPSNNISFVPIEKKKISKERIDAFWKNYFSGNFRDSHLNRILFNGKTDYISSYNNLIKVFPITPTTLVTIRRVVATSYNAFKKDYFLLKRKISKIKLKYSKIELVEIISSRRKAGTYFYYTMERVFPSISINDLEFILRNQSKLTKEGIIKRNRYAPSFLKEIENKKINKEKMLNDLERAYTEFKNSKLLRYCDASSNNIIILDYNPEKSTFKFGLIDFSYKSTSKSY
jgi:hypothetical protein